MLDVILAELASGADYGLMPMGRPCTKFEHGVHPPDCRVLATTRRVVGLATVAFVGATKRTTTRGAGAASWITLAPAGAFWPGLSLI